MPTVDRIGPYRFFFFSNEGNEPAHIHVQRDSKLAKFWLEPVVLVSSAGFTAHELREIEELVESNQNTYLEKWNEYFA